MTVPIYTLTGRLKHFLPAWRLLSKDQSILSLAEWFKIPLLQEPKQIFPQKLQQWNKDQKELIDLEVKEMLERDLHSFTSGGRISQSSISSREKGWNRPVINLKNLNKCLPY